MVMRCVVSLGVVSLVAVVLLLLPTPAAAQCLSCGEHQLTCVEVENGAHTCTWGSGPMGEWMCFPGGGACGWGAMSMTGQLVVPTAAWSDLQQAAATGQTFLLDDSSGAIRRSCDQAIVGYTTIATQSRPTLHQPPRLDRIVLG